MGKEQVLKIPGMAIEKFGEFAKKLGGEAKAFSPEIKTFDYVTGPSKVHGEFNIFTFRDEHGNILNKKFKFGEKIFERTYSHNSKVFGNRGFVIVEQTNSEVNNIKITGLIDKGDSFQSLRELYTGTGTDTLALARLESKKPKREITIKTSWDGKAPEIVYDNTIGQLPNQDLELLPLLMATPSIRGEAKVNHLANVFEKEHGLKGVVPKPVIDTSDFLEKAYGSREGVCEFETGQVWIGSDVVNGDGVTILDVMAHEYQHAKDYSDCWRLKSIIDEFYKFIKDGQFSPDKLRFIKKSMAKGRIRDNSKLGQILKKIRYEIDNYKELCKKLGHDNLLSEDRALNTECDVLTRFENICKEALAIIGF